MVHGQALESGSDGRDIDIVEISVVLVATSNNPSILNPDFLRYNKIVNSDRQVQDPHVSTPAYSQVTFEGGLTVKADPERVIFEQQGNALSVDDIVCPETARRYVKNVPHVPYRAVGINPKGFILSTAVSEEKVVNALVNNGAWMKFKDNTPNIQLKAIYRSNERTITLDIAEVRKKGTDGSEVPGLLFQGNFHRDIKDGKPQKRINRLTSVLQSWREDLSDFNLLVRNFCERR